MATADLYEVLGCSRNASAADIRKAYKRLARKYHPDVNPGDKAAEERFKAISEAYGVLSDTQKRQAYDRFGAAQPGAGPGGGWDPRGFDFGDLGGGGLGDLFATILGGGRRAASPPPAQRGRDLEAVLRIGFLDAIRGLTSPITVARQAPCESCGGSGARPGSQTSTCGRCQGRGRVDVRRGFMAVQTMCKACDGTGRLSPRDCPTCGGAGRVARQETIQIRIPAGVTRGARLKVAGKGDAGRPTAPAGDLHVTIQVSPHPVFERRGDNICCTVPVTVSEAALGARIEVPTVDGRAMLRVPPGTQSGQQLRLRGKGAPSLRGGRGDQFIEIQVVVPEARDQETRRLLEDLAARTGAASRDHLFGRK
jgi:molecular chaperone DnaJ